MENWNENPRTKWWRIAVIIIIIAIIAIVIALLLRNCSSSSKPTTWVFYSQNMDSRDIPPKAYNTIPEIPSSSSGSTGCENFTSGNGIGTNPNSPPSDHPGDIDPSSTSDGSSTDPSTGPGCPSNPAQPGGIDPTQNPGGTGNPAPPPDPEEKHPGEKMPPRPPQNPPDVGDDDDPSSGDIFNPGGLLPNGGKKGGILWIIILIILLIFYISGRVIIFRGGALRIWASTFDKILVAAAAVLFLISCLFDPNPNQPPTEIVVTLRSISGALMTWSCILSVLINWPNPLFIIISILCKAFFFYCVWWFFFLAIFIALISLAFRVANDLTDYRHNDY